MTRELPAGLSHRMQVTLAMAGVTIVLCSLFVWIGTQESESARIRKARTLLAGQQVEDAGRIVAELIREFPDRSDIRRLAMDVAVKGGDWQSVFRMTDDFWTELQQDPDFATRIARVEHFEVGNLARAETLYRLALSSDQEFVPACEGLARLYSASSRRCEAIPLILTLVRHRAAADLLTVLARESGAIRDDGLLQKAIAADPNGVSALLGMARITDADGQAGVLMELCQHATRVQSTCPAAFGELGKYLLKANDYAQLSVWHQQLPEHAIQHPDVQKVLGFFFLHTGDRVRAAESLLNSARQLPDSAEVFHQLSRLLHDAGETAAGERFAQQVLRMKELHELQDRVLFSEIDITPDRLLPLIERYESMGRLYEACGWAQECCLRFPEAAACQKLRDRLEARISSEPLELMSDAENPVRLVDQESLLRRLRQRSGK